jgi:hypothetical protein
MSEKSRKIQIAFFSKWRAAYWILFTLLYLFLFVYDLYRNNNFFLGQFDDKDWSTPIGIGLLFWICQWHPHLVRVLTTKNPHIRIEGDKIIAFGKVFPKGQENYLLFEKQKGFRVGYWITLRNEQEEITVPLLPERYFEDYDESKLKSKE